MFHLKNPTYILSENALVPPVLVASFTFYFWEYITLNFYRLYVLRLILINNLYVLPQSNHVIIFTLIKIIFMLHRLSWSIWSTSYEVSWSWNLPFNLLSWVQSPHRWYYIIYIYSIEASREWITSSLDATLIFLYVDLKFMPQFFGYFFFTYLVHHLFYWDF